jgi:hypothetical protein
MRPLTGKVIGAHQKIDRLARAGLGHLVGRGFPSSRQIVHFEGVNGPDAIKRKSPARDEPWHFFSPFDENDTQIIQVIGSHYDELVKALKKNDEIRAAFEAAWLAHAVVDGLTPAHHYPYEEKLAELRGGLGNETRASLKDKMIMPGQTRREMLRNNWRMWGPKGLLTAHGVFEWGVALIMAPLTEKNIKLTKEDIKELNEQGMLDLFKRKAKEVAALSIYEEYVRLGWTPMLARRVRKKVVPVIVKTVTLTWYAAAIDAGLVKRPRR